jgi:hypothetical protein
MSPRLLRFTNLLTGTFVLVLLFGCSTTQNIYKDPILYPSHFNYDTVTAKRFDTGKMWTFEHAPKEYWKETYNFEATDEWLESVRLPALKFGSWCTASFVSEDGLIMTNHHCVDNIIPRIAEEGENLQDSGFFAKNLADERKVDRLKVDQLLLIEDVTDEVNAAFNSGKTNEEKVANRDAKIAELNEKFSEETGLICQIRSLYNGGKYSLYGYKRYSDIRAVFINETDIGLWGGDPDNFTYPRYNADFAFLRAYDEEGNPLKTPNFYKFSQEDIDIDDPLFVIGNPGSTSRLKTVAQLEYDRDFTYRSSAYKLEKYIDALYELVNELPERAEEIGDRIVMAGNSAKVYGNTYRALVDPYIIVRKKDFEDNFKKTIMADAELKTKYGHIWKSIENTRTELRSIAPERYAYRISRFLSPKYFDIAGSLISLAKELALPEEQRSEAYKTEMLDSTIAAIFPEDFDYEVDYKKIRLHADFITEMLGKSHPVVKNFSNGLTGEQALEYVKKTSKIMTPEAVSSIAKKGSDAILNSDDPFIQFLLATEEKLAELDVRAKEIADSEKALNGMLGQAMFAVYGTSIPPDATFTLRINDGTLKNFDYNGTIAPVFTTFYGMYDRYHSNAGKFPWNLPERWQNPGEEFDMSTKFNFVTDHDITGGSSGSAVINTNGEVVGLAFDGNMESITGNILYLPENNRMVSVSAQAMLEILDDIADAKRISDELRKGKIPETHKTIDATDEEPEPETSEE